MSIITTDRDKEAFGLLICKDKNSFVVDYATDSKDKPMAVIEYQLSQMPPELLATFLQRWGLRVS